MVEKTHPQVVKAQDVGLPSYLDMSAEMGFTKHLGGQISTKALADMCRIGRDSRVLNVGCGSGHGSIFLALEYDCEVEGVDVLTRMVEAAQENVERFGLSERIHIQEGDAQALPFENNLFDAVLCESVNTFVPDKPKAFREYYRVLKPGGQLGFNEGLWIAEPPLKGRQLMEELVGWPLLSPGEWGEYMRGAGFVDLKSDVRSIQARIEVRGQFGLIGIKEYVHILGRFLRLFLGNRETRELYKQALADPSEYYSFMGYGLYSAGKPNS